MLLCVVSNCIFLGAHGQVRSDTPYALGNTTQTGLTSVIQLPDDIDNNHRLTSPRLTQTIPASGDRRSTSYWTSNVTTKSYGRGKWGTFYYWDVQGNLREMRGFVDIAGKNKRGLKLVFPWR